MGISLYAQLPAAAREGVALTTIASMNTICHALEDAVLDVGVPTTLYVGFQKISFFRKQEQRYRQLAALCDKIFICAVFDEPPPSIPNITFLALDPYGALSREWFLLVDTQQFSSALIAREADGSGTTGPRRFEAIWTYDAAVVQAAAEAMARYANWLYLPPARRDGVAQQTRMMRIAKQLLQAQEARGARAAHARHRTALLSAALGDTGSALLLTDADGTIAAATPGAAQLLGVSATTVIGTAIDALADGALRALTSARSDTSLATTITTAQGRSLRVSARQVHDVDDQLVGRILALHGGSNDTDQKHLVQLIHSIQPDLHALRELATMLPRFAERADWQTLLHNNINRLADHLSIRLQRIELLQQISTEVVARELPVNAAVLARELAEEQRITTEPRNIQIRTVVNGDPLLYGDPGRIRLALRELIKNAVTATRDGGVVEVTIGRQGSYLELRVSDTGAGIPLDAQRPLLDPFFQRDESGTTKTGGLGLSLVSAVAQAHAGYIGIDSDQTTGTQVTMLLPVHPSSAFYLHEL